MGVVASTSTFAEDHLVLLVEEWSRWLITEGENRHVTLVRSEVRG